MRKLLFASLLLGLSIVAAPVARAHPFGQKPVLFAASTGSGVSVQWVAAPDEFRVLAQHLALGPVSAEAMGDMEAFSSYFVERLRIEGDGRACTGTVDGVAPVSTGYAVSARYDCGGPVTSARFEVTLLHDVSKDYVTLRSIRTQQGPVRGAFTVDAPALEVDLVSRAVAAPSPDAEPSGLDDRILGMIEGHAGSVSLAFAIVLAFALGALHGLTPGHGKTIAAAYLVGSGGTARDAFALGGVVTLTHALSTALVAAIPLALGEQQPPAVLAGWLEVTAGIIIIAFGVAMLARTRRTHAHDHEHAPSPQMPLRRLATIGFVGGLVPNPEALLIVLVAFSLHRWTAGVALIAAFSLGLGLVVLGIAGAAVKGGRLVRRIASGRLAALAPRAAVVVFLLMGALVVVNGIRRI